jgi:ATP-dependent metalloprotease
LYRYGEARDAASGPGSVVAYLQSLGKLDRLDQFDVQMPPPAQLSMAAAAVMRDGRGNLTTEEATEAVTQAVAVAAADRSELPALLRDLSKRAEGREDVVRLPPGRTAASPLHIALSDGYGNMGGGGNRQSKGGGLINFIFYSVMAVVLGSASMGALRTYAAKVSNKGGTTSTAASSASGSTPEAGGAGGLLPGAGPRLPGLGKARAGEEKKESSFDPKEYNKDALPEKSVKTFNDVKGCDEAKQELQEIVEYLKNPDKFTKLGGKLPKGVLLSGPPGTGKTLLARAVAGEAGVPFFYRAGSEFEEMFVGVGSKRVRQLFAAAKKKTPCIIFIDEIDAIGTSRKAFETQSRKTLNQLLTEMDGFEQNEGVIVIAATNIPEQLDPALTRPGRFDRMIHVGNPDIGGRREILTHYLADKPCDADVDVESLARGTAGFSGAELANLVNVAAVQAAVTGETSIGGALLEWAKDRIIMGVERKSAVLTEESKRLTAYHEAGHAVVALRTPGAMPVHKATIVPRGSALGMVTQLPDKDETSITRKQLLARLDVCMGGRVAEELIFGRDEVTTGAISDLQQATRLAAYMVAEVGLSDLVGPVHVDSMSKGGRSKTEAGPFQVRVWNYKPKP